MPPAVQHWKSIVQLLQALAQVKEQQAMPDSKDAISAIEMHLDRLKELSPLPRSVWKQLIKEVKVPLHVGTACCRLQLAPHVRSSNSSNNAVCVVEGQPVPPALPIAWKAMALLLTTAAADVFAEAAQSGGADMRRLTNRTAGRSLAQMLTQQLTQSGFMQHFPQAAAAVAVLLQPGACRSAAAGATGTTAGVGTDVAHNSNSANTCSDEASDCGGSALASANDSSNGDRGCDANSGSGDVSAGVPAPGALEPLASIALLQVSQAMLTVIPIVAILSCHNSNSYAALTRSCAMLAIGALRHISTAVEQQVPAATTAAVAADSAAAAALRGSLSALAVGALCTVARAASTKLHSLDLLRYEEVRGAVHMLVYMLYAHSWVESTQQSGSTSSSHSGSSGSMQAEVGSTGSSNGTAAAAAAAAADMNVLRRAAMPVLSDAEGTAAFAVPLCLVDLQEQPHPAFVDIPWALREYEGVTCKAMAWVVTEAEPSNEVFQSALLATVAISSRSTGRLKYGLQTQQWQLANLQQQLQQLQASHLVAAGEWDVTEADEKVHHDAVLGDMLLARLLLCCAGQGASKPMLSRAIECFEAARAANVALAGYLERTKLLQGLQQQQQQKVMTPSQHATFKVVAGWLKFALPAMMYIMESLLRVLEGTDRAAVIGGAAAAAAAAAAGDAASSNGSVATACALAGAGDARAFKNSSSSSSSSSAQGDRAKAVSVAQRGIVFVLQTVSTAAQHAILAFNKQGTDSYDVRVAPALSHYNLGLCAALERFSRVQAGLHFLSGDSFAKCFQQTSLLDVAGGPFVCAMNAGQGSAEQARLCSAAYSVLKVCGVVQAVQPAAADAVRRSIARSAAEWLLRGESVMQLVGTESAGSSASSNPAAAVAADGATEAPAAAVGGGAADEAAAAAGTRLLTRLQAVVSDLPWLVLFGRCCLQWAEQLRQLQSSAPELGQELLSLLPLLSATPAASAAAATNLKHLGLLSAHPVMLMLQGPLMREMLSKCAGWLKVNWRVKLLVEPGYQVEDLLQQFDAVLAAHTALQQQSSQQQQQQQHQENTLNRQPSAAIQAYSEFVMQLQALGVALTSLPTPQACNNPYCCNLSGPSETALVSGRGNMCGGCRVARYCSRVCQRQHWKQHKAACKTLAVAAATTCS